MKRRRPAGRKIYSINYLLDIQPKALRKKEKWPLMLSYLSSDPKLLQLRFNRRCYSLLHNAVIRPEHLENFYRTYKLPKNPFFPLFFLLKREYIEERERKKREREEYIRKGLIELPDYVKALFTLTAYLEKEMNGSSGCPVYRRSFLPKSKKRMDDYKKYSHGDWIRFYDEYLGKLGTRYEKLPLKKVEYLDASLALQCLPDPDYRPHQQEEVVSQYRKLSKEYHPDRGGDPSLFIKLKWAKEILQKT